MGSMWGSMERQGGRRGGKGGGGGKEGERGGGQGGKGGGKGVGGKQPTHLSPSVQITVMACNGAWLDLSELILYYACWNFSQLLNGAAHSAMLPGISDNASRTCHPRTTVATAIMKTEQSESHNKAVNGGCAWPRAGAQDRDEALRLIEAPATSIRPLKIFYKNSRYDDI